MDVSTPAANRLHDLLGPFFSNPQMIARDQDLRELGLTSMQMINLMLSIEAEFDVTIPPPKLLPTNFRSIEAIETLLIELMH